MLNKKLSKKIEVINKGMPGSNSPQVLKNLPSQIRLYKPQIIIALTGRNDYTNFAESNYFLFTGGLKKRWLSRLESLFARLRTYKLFKMGVEDLIFKIRFALFKSDFKAMQNSPVLRYNLSKKEKERINILIESALRQASYDEYFVDMFGGDFGHCTMKGNRLLAENIANVILKECFNK